jgi:polyisoprenoid-binding protein YceI
MKSIFIIVLAFNLFYNQYNVYSQAHAAFAPTASVKFTINNAGIPVTGTIDTVKARITFDPSRLSESMIEASADPATIHTGIAIRDKHLKRSDYFDVSHFPSIHLISKTFRRIGNNKFTGEFDLTIKGVTRSITIFFYLDRKTNTVQYKGCFTLNRLDFHLGEKSRVLAEQVTIEVEAVTNN